MNNTPTKHDIERMRALVEFTSSSLSTEFPSPFGSAIYESSSGRLVSQAYDTVMRECDPTNHAEVNAIRLATQELGRLSLRGCVLYSTCEPCPMCMSASIWAELDGVVFGASTMEDANLYWPQGSDMTPQELISRMRFEPKCSLLRHVERALCQELFRKCDEVRKSRELELPPHRDT
jgi:tRNA(adenine34) deaminase